MNFSQKKPEYMDATVANFFIQDVGAQDIHIRTDEEAIYACQNGSKQAFGFLVQRYMQRGYYSALGLVTTHDAALDLSQEAFVRAFVAINKFDREKQFFTWYYQILRNLCFNFLRDKKRHARSFSEISDYEINTIFDAAASADAEFLQEETRKMVWQALNQLKPDDREILVLKEFQELSYKEIADILSIPMGTVMSRLFNARRALKNKLERIYA